MVTNAGTDAVLFTLRQGLKHLVERGKPGRVLKHTQRKLIQDGMPRNQAMHLIQLLTTNQILQRGALNDVQRLADLIHEEVRQAGYLQEEADQLYSTLIYTLFQMESEGSALIASAHAAMFLKAYPSPSQRALQQQFQAANQHPVQYSTQQLQEILRQAQQTTAKLVVRADGKPEFHDLHLQISAKGEQARVLQEAVTRVLKGEEVSIQGDVRFTAGHPDLDHFLHFDQPAAELHLKPLPNVQRRELRLRAPGGLEATLTAEIHFEPGQQQFTLLLASTPELAMRLTFSDQEIAWNGSINFGQHLPTKLHRDVLRFLALMGLRNARLIDNSTGLELLTYREPDPHLLRLRQICIEILECLDLQEFVQALPNGHFSFVPLEQLPPQDRSIYRRMAQHAAGTLLATQQHYIGDFVLTPALAQALSQSASRKRVLMRLTHTLTLPDCTPLELSLEFVGPHVTVRQRGKRLSYAKLSQHTNQVVTLDIRGQVAESTLNVATLDSTEP